MVNIILGITFIPIWPILYFITRNYVKPKKNIILGVTLPQAVHGDDEVMAIVFGFKRWLNLTMLPLLPLMIPPFLMKSVGASLTWHMTWLLVLIVLPNAVFAFHREKLMSLKRDRGWFSDAESRTLVDIKAAAIPAMKISGVWFLIPCVISLIPLAYEFLSSSELVYAAIYAVFTIITIFFWISYHFIFLLRTETVNEDLTLTLALTRVRRYNWGKFWLAASWLTGVLNIFLWIFSENITAFLVVTLVYTIALLCIALQTEFGTRRAQQRLTAANPGSLYVDEDEFWIWGLFYCNPNDKHFLVNDRIGMNMTVNLAKTGAKVVMGLSLLCIVAMPFIGIWILAEEATPVRLVLSETDLIARHTSNRYTIPLGEIDSVELLEELPLIISRVNGTSLSNLSKGRFLVRGHGTSFLCLKPDNPPFLMIVAGDRTYFINDIDAGVTIDVYAWLTMPSHRGRTP